MAENTKRGLGSADDQTREETARKGGEAVSKDREHMAEIGKKGGEARQSKGSSHKSEEGEEGKEKSSGTRGGSSEQHAKAGEQSHKKSA
jgi:general stress protein YciG